MAVSGQEVLVLGKDGRMAVDAGEEFLGAPIHRFRRMFLDQARESLQTLQDIGTLNARNVA